MIKKEIGYGTGFEVYPVSASDKHGKEKLLSAVESYLNPKEVEV